MRRRSSSFNSRSFACHLWVIDKEVFCEGHKELIIETFGVDHFSISRLTNEDDAFVVCGRLSKTNPIKKQATTPPRDDARLQKS